MKPPALLEVLDEKLNASGEEVKSNDDVPDLREPMIKLDSHSPRQNI